MLGKQLLLAQFTCFSSETGSFKGRYPNASKPLKPQKTSLIRKHVAYQKGKFPAFLLSDCPNPKLNNQPWGSKQYPSG